MPELLPPASQPIGAHRVGRARIAVYRQLRLLQGALTLGQTEIASDSPLDKTVGVKSVSRAPSEALAPNKRALGLLLLVLPRPWDAASVLLDYHAEVEAIFLIFGNCHRFEDSAGYEGGVLGIVDAGPLVVRGTSAEL